MDGDGDGEVAARLSIPSHLKSVCGSEARAELEGNWGLGNFVAGAWQRWRLVFTNCGCQAILTLMTTPARLLYLAHLGVYKSAGSLHITMSPHLMITSIPPSRRWRALRDMVKSRRCTFLTIQMPMKIHSRPLSRRNHNQPSGTLELAMTRPNTTSSPPVKRLYSESWRAFEESTNRSKNRSRAWATLGAA